MKKRLDMYVTPVPQNPAYQRKNIAREVVLQRMFGAKRRRRKVLPRQLSPKAVAVEYAKALRTMFRLAMEAYKPVLAAFGYKVRMDALPTRVKVPKPVEFYSVETPTRGEDFAPAVKVQARQAKRLLDEAEARLEAAVSTSEIESLALKFAARTSTQQRMQLGRQVRTAVGADPYMRDPVLAGVTEDFVAQNVSLIKRIPTRLHEKIEGLVMNSVGKSELNVNLATSIQAQFGVAERHATLIARDQISKYYGAVNRARQQELGVRKFIWRSVNDERVRDEHAELEGKEFSWDDLPTNRAGDDIYPGSEIQCRCSAEPVLDEILEDVGAAEADLEPPTFDDVPEVFEDDED